MRRFWAIGTVTLALVICASTLAGDAEKEKARLQGSWTVTKVMFKGEDKTKEFGELSYTFAGDKSTVKIGGESREGTFKIVDAMKKPMQIDFSIKQIVSKAIYEIDGDTLKLATGDRGADRPSGFDAKDITVFTFKKVSK